MATTAPIIPSDAPSLATLKGAAARAWSRDTSVQPDEWSEGNPALGQCAVTALVVQDVVGGDLVQAIVNGISHYWNRLDSGEEVDLTRQQFGENVRIETRPVIQSRSHVLSFPDTVSRYELLRERLNRA